MISFALNTYLMKLGYLGWPSLPFKIMLTKLKCAVLSDEGETRAGRESYESQAWDNGLRHPASYGAGGFWAGQAVSRIPDRQPLCCYKSQPQNPNFGGPECQGNVVDIDVKILMRSRFLALLLYQPTAYFYFYFLWLPLSRSCPRSCHPSSRCLLQPCVLTSASLPTKIISPQSSSRPWRNGSLIALRYRDHPVKLLLELFALLNYSWVC